MDDDIGDAADAAGEEDAKEEDAEGEEDEQFDVAGEEEEECWKRNEREDQIWEVEEEWKFLSLIWLPLGYHREGGRSWRCCHA